VSASALQPRAKLGKLGSGLGRGTTATLFAAVAARKRERAREMERETEREAESEMERERAPLMQNGPAHSCEAREGLGGVVGHISTPLQQGDCVENVTSRTAHGGAQRDAHDDDVHDDRGEASAETLSLTPAAAAAIATPPTLAMETSARFRMHADTRSDKHTHMHLVVEAGASKYSSSAAQYSGEGVSEDSAMQGRCSDSGGGTVDGLIIGQIWQEGAEGYVSTGEREISGGRKGRDSVKRGGGEMEPGDNMGEVGGVGEMGKDERGRTGRKGRVVGLQGLMDLDAMLESWDNPVVGAYGGGSTHRILRCVNVRVFGCGVRVPVCLDIVLYIFLYGSLCMNLFVYVRACTAHVWMYFAFIFSDRCNVHEMYDG